MTMPNARALRHRVEVLTLTETDGGWAYAADGTRAADVRQEDKRNLFSSLGLGRPTVRFTMRRGPLTLHQALRLHGKHCFLTAIAPVQDARGYIEVTAALIEPTPCTVSRRAAVRDPVYLRPKLEPERTVAFPGFLTEKYVRFEAGTPGSVSERCNVLVTPKAVTLAVGELVTVGGEAWRVQIPHELDEFKNEYEIVREVDA